MKKIVIGAAIIVLSACGSPAPPTSPPAAAEAKVAVLTPPLPTKFENGDYAVGVNLKPGTYSNEGGPGCSYVVYGGAEGRLRVVKKGGAGREVVHLVNGQFASSSGCPAWVPAP